MNHHKIPLHPPFPKGESLSPPFAKGVRTGDMGNKRTGDIGNRLRRTSQINLTDDFMTEHHFKQTVCCHRPDPDGISIKGATDPKCFTSKEEIPFVLDFTNLHAAWIFDRRQYFGHISQTGPIPRSRYRQIQRVMGSLKIVLIPPGIKFSLKMNGILPLVTSEKLFFQGPMKPFIFAQGLWMIRAAMTYPDSQAKQPNRQRRIAVLRVIAPRRSIIHQENVRKAIAFEGLLQGALHPRPLLARQRLKAEVKPRIVIQDRQGVTRTRQGRYGALKIHLPQSIGSRGFKSPPVLTPPAWDNQPMTMKKGSNGTASRNRFYSHLLQLPPKFTRSPSGMGSPQMQKRLFVHFPYLQDNSVRPAGSVLQPFYTSFFVTSQPFVSRLTTNIKPTAQFSQAHFRPLGQLNKLPTQRHKANLFPWHNLLLKCNLSEIMPHKVLPMSPAHLLPISPVYTKGRPGGILRSDFTQLI